MKIAIFVHCFYPDHIYGTEAYTLLVAKELQAAGHEPVVVSAVFAGEKPQKTFIDRYVWEGVPVISIDKNVRPHANLRETYDQPDMRVVHERILRLIEPDVVYVTHLVNHSAALLEVAGAMGIPTFGTLTDFFGFCLTNKLQDANDRLCAGPNASRSNCMACYIRSSAEQPGASDRLRLSNRPSTRPFAARAMAFRARRPTPERQRHAFDPNDVVARPDVLREHYKTYQGLIAPSSFLYKAYQRNGVPAPLTLSHFGIEIDRSPKPVAPKSGPLRIAFIGQIAPHKGVHLLIQAFNALPPGSASLEIWGPEDQDLAYMAELRRLAGDHQVAFKGTFKAAATAKILSKVDVMVVPSTWYENSPLILLQALATHTPVIVSDVEGMTEFVQNGENGFHFKRGDADDLAVQLQRFVDDETLARAMSARTRYDRTPADMVRDILNMIEQGLAQASPVKPSLEEQTK